MWSSSKDNHFLSTQRSLIHMQGSRTFGCFPPQKFKQWQKAINIFTYEVWRTGDCSCIIFVDSGFLSTDSTFSLKDITFMNWTGCNLLLIYFGTNCFWENNFPKKTSNNTECEQLIGRGNESKMDCKIIILFHKLKSKVMGFQTKVVTFAVLNVHVFH